MQTKFTITSISVNIVLESKTTILFERDVFSKTEQNEEEPIDDFFNKDKKTNCEFDI